MSSREKQLYEFGPFRLDPIEHTLVRDGRPIPIRPKVFDLLLVLVENRGHLVDKEQLMSSVWTEQFVEEGNINKNISMLRRALGEADNGERFIETVPRRGYRFIADVRTVDFEEQTELRNSATWGDERSKEAEFSHPPSAPAQAVTPARNQRFTRGWIFFLIVAALLVVALGYVVFKRERRGSGAPNVASIVVLPFQNLSNDSTQDYFVDGVTDALIGDLAKLGALRVISRTSAMHYKGSQKSLPEIAK